ncbi:hypothetical protein AC578_7125 [Pseudocercospora eumusae]|uniref:MHYT domain-containing protein n=1 Tax=Pseudocercospora eumusae TaxID=321146 RepID=A0A139HXD9_9PEZI|nr:hypothetical protein AC578_7125 [Pseudocercospora eumusae]KXT07022.1 hypothetical protein AC578_7125 [Pseudocercospora eumusae]
MAYERGSIVPSTFDPGIVAASYFASLTGCLLTIEILHRRGTAFGNFRSWAETVACATSMGLVGIWSMHFIGNRAIVLGNGMPKYQLVYNPGYTVLSVFLPILGLTIAFSVAELPAKRPIIHWAALSLTGVFAGLSVVGMHYLGNFGVANYRLNYSPRYLAASIIIAIGDCLTVLVLFYNLREKWISAWWKRVMCAAALAGGVSAMHFTASTSCQYEFRSVNSGKDIDSRDTQVIVAGVLCATAAFMVLGVLVITRTRYRILRNRSQKVMLACAMFDPKGRVLVTTDGVLPSREITDKYVHRTFDEDFDTTHPVFQWIYRVTFHWAGVSELIPKMKSHLAAERESTCEESRPTSSQSSVMYDAETYTNYALIFKERFCVAASSLAASMHLPVKQLGVLYDKVVETGTLKVEAKDHKRNSSLEERSMAEVEAALRLNLFGKGQLMFITKQLTEDETNNSLNAGFKFANVQHVGRTIAQAMQIPQSILDAHMNGLKRYNENLMSMDKPGTYLTFFAMIPKPNGKGFDIAVRKDCQDQLPDQPLLTGKPFQWQALFLEKLDGFLVKQCVDFCDNRTIGVPRQPHVQQFAVMVKQAIVTLTQQFPAEWRNQARFWARPLSAHYSHRLQNRSTITTLYAFTVIGDMHASIEASEAVSRIPRTFFEARHRCYAGSPDHAILTKDIHAAFGPLFSRKISKPKKYRRHGKLSVALASNPMTHLRKHSTGAQISSSRESIDHIDEHSSMHELVDKPMHPSDSSRGSEKQQRNDWGGILVNSETVIKTDSKTEFSNDDKDGLAVPYGLKVAVGTAKPETTFVDELVTITKERFLPASKAGM